MKDIEQIKEYLCSGDEDTRHVGINLLLNQEMTDEEMVTAFWNLPTDNYSINKKDFKEGFQKVFKRPYGEVAVDLHKKGLIS